MITGIGHAAFAVKDMKAALHFYCDQIGLKHVFSIADNDGNPWIEYVKVADGQFIEFFYVPEGQYLPPNGSYKHLCLEVDDIHAQAKALEAVGIALRVKPTRGKDNNWQAWADDPDGNPIEFMQIDPSSPHANT